MSVVVIELGAFVLLAKYLHQKHPGGVYFFNRRIPEDIQKYYPAKKSGKFYHSLKTRDLKEAAKRANLIAIQQDALWKSYREGKTDYGPDLLNAAEALLRSHNLKPGDGLAGDAMDIAVGHFIDHLHTISGVHGGPRDAHEQSADSRAWYEYLPPEYQAAGDLLFGEKRPAFLSEALVAFQELRGEDPNTKSGQDRIRVVNDFIARFGDRPVDKYSRQDARDFVGALLAKGNSPTTVQRRLNSIRPVFKDAALEGEFEDRRIFDSIKIPDLASSAKERLPFKVEEIALIQEVCFGKNDTLRQIVALLSDTGLRLAEAVGLHVDDVFLNADIPFVWVRPNEVRTLKTRGSERKVPLVGAALWAATNALPNARGGFLFPRYINSRTNPPTHKATYASNSLNQWIRTLPITESSSKSTHSFRHSIQDRLRAIETPDEIRNAICGWKNSGVGQGYGTGFPLEVLAKHLERIVIPRKP